MSNPINGHIEFAERAKWDGTTLTVETHMADGTAHLPTPPSDSSTTNYYLGSDLKWHKTPITSIS